MQKPGYDRKFRRILKKGGEEKEEDRDIKMLKRSFWMWGRSFNRKASPKPAWFVLPGSAGENPIQEGDIEKGMGGSLERKERDVMATSENENKGIQEGSGGRMKYNPMKSFWKWERALNSLSKVISMGTNSGDIMDAIKNQLVISMGTEMENTDHSQNMG